MVRKTETATTVDRKEEKEMLSKLQEFIVKTNEPRVLVSSAAASGKTEVLIQRLKFLLDSGVDPSKIVAITFTNNAASVMYERLGRPVGLFIGTVHSYCNYLLRSSAIDTSNLLDNEQFDDLFPLIKENPFCFKEVEHLLVDEAQDSTEAQFEFFELINPHNYMYFFDIRQSIYGWNGADPEYLIKKMGEPDVVVYRMNQNYRNLPDILHFAKKFLYRLGAAYEDDSVPMRKRENHYTVIEGDMTPSEAVNVLIKSSSRLNSNWGDWFLLCRTNADIELFSKLLNDKGIPNDTFKQSELTNSEIEDRMKEDTVKILTAHSAKGLENKYVMVFNVRAYNDAEARLCYVAATRARDCLIWVKMPPKKRKAPKVVSWE